MPTTLYPNLKSASVAQTFTERKVSAQLSTTQALQAIITVPRREQMSYAVQHTSLAGKKAG